MTTNGTCGVCGQQLTGDWLTPPTFRLEKVGNVVRPVLNKQVRVDPETGAICWCDPPADDQ